MNKPDMSHLPLCECANSSGTCIGRKPGVACMAHDDWYSKPAERAKNDPPADEENDWHPLSFLRR